MAFTRDYHETVVDRLKKDQPFAQALLDEAVSLFVNGEAETAKLILRDLVQATIGFESLAQEVHKPPKSLYKMLSRSGNPSMQNVSLNIRSNQTSPQCKYSNKSRSGLITPPMDRIKIPGLGRRAPHARVIETPSGTYRPIVVDFSQRDGRERLEQIRAHILAGTFENWLELVVLPLYGKEKGDQRSAFVEEVVRFQMELCRAERISSRLPAATLILSNKMIDRKRLDAMWEEIKMLDIIEIAREKGIEEGKILGISEGKTLGISEGKTLGISEGKIQNARETIMDLLMDKFGYVPEHIQQEIDRMESLVNLKALLRHIQRCADLEAFEALLERIRASSSPKS